MMNAISFKKSEKIVWGNVLANVAMTLMMFGGNTAFAQLSQPGAKLSAIQTLLLGVGGTVASLALLWVGFKMVFKHAAFQEVAHVFLGGLFIGCAGAFGAWIVS